MQLEGLDHLGVVAIHANTLRRALLNLVQNALEAMPQGKPAQMILYASGALSRSDFHL
jgi:signal transduction histidine kinase